MHNGPASGPTGGRVMHFAVPFCPSVTDTATDWWNDGRPKKLQIQVPIVTKM